MVTQQSLGSQLRGYLGGALTLAGSAIILFDSALLALKVRRLVVTSGGGTVGILSTLGVSFLRTIQAVAFHEFDYSSLFLCILLLFSALGATIVGTALLRSRAACAGSAGQLNSTGFTEGDR